MNDNLKKNGDGYYDPTAYKAIKAAEEETVKFQKLLDTIFNICELSGFHIEGRITIKSKNTGRIWR
ncbi:hypothetical protein [[Ruminococcus] lactaris]|jgi:hypothetical protein|uniref:hypothetical protein n=1 Tax=[Ruminococcus] lactaris TaxID=46228 RepID=UPI0039F49F09